MRAIDHSRLKRFPSPGITDTSIMASPHRLLTDHLLGPRFGFTFVIGKDRIYGCLPVMMTNSGYFASLDLTTLERELTLPGVMITKPFMYVWEAINGLKTQLTWHLLNPEERVAVWRELNYYAVAVDNPITVEYLQRLTSGVITPEIRKVIEQIPHGITKHWIYKIKEPELLVKSRLELASQLMCSLTTILPDIHPMLARGILATRDPEVKRPGPAAPPETKRLDPVDEAQIHHAQLDVQIA